MRGSILIIFGLIVFSSVMGQNLDSLQIILKGEKTDSVKMKLISETGERLLKSNKPEALPYFEELHSLAEAAGNKLMTATALSRIGVCWYQRNEINKAMDFYYKALESTEEKSEFFDVLIRLHNNIGWNFNQLGIFDKAIDHYHKALKFANDHDDVNLKGHLLNNMAVAHKNLKEYDVALYYLNTSLEINRKAGNKKLEQFNLNNICVILIETSKFDEALINLEELYEVNVALGDSVEMCNNLANMADANLQLKHLADAEVEGKKTLLLAQKINNQQLIREALELLSNIAKEQDRYEEAYDYLFRLRELSDSIARAGQDKYTLELEEKYNSLIKDQDLHDANEKIVRQKLYNTITISALFITVLSSIFFWRLLRIKRKSENKLVKLNDEIQKQSEELKQVNEEIKAVNENLEKTITARTAVIMNQNIRLREFTFMNSHRIRGPVANILGIINLLQDKRNDHLKPEILDHLKSSTQELDIVIREVNRYLEHDDDFFKDMESSDPKRD